MPTDNALPTPARAPRRRGIRFARFDSATGRPRRRWTALAAGIALALFAGSGIAVAAVNAAEAHVPDITVNCSGVQVVATMYNPGVVNTVSVTIGDTTVTRTFGEEFRETFTFPDPSVATSYSATIDGGDGGNNNTEWDLTKSGVSEPCSTPKIQVSATQCDKPGQSSVVTALLSGLDAAHGHVVELTSNGGTSAGPDRVNPNTPSFQWTVEPGFTYTATIRDTVTNLSAQATVLAVGCPEDPTMQVWGDECSAPKSNGKFNATVSDLVVGRDYTLALVTVGGGSQIVASFEATSDTFSGSFDAPPSGSYFLTVSDDVTGATKQSATLKFLPCPDKPGDPTLNIVQCSATDGTSNASITATVEKLIPGRSYTITVVTGATTVYTESLPFVASSTWSKKLENLAPGTYTVTATDVSDPKVTGYSSTATTVLVLCPKQQDVALSATECSVPGGKGDLIATVTNFVPGRTYSIVLTQSGLPVAGQPVSEDFTPVDTTPQVFDYVGLAPDLTYRVVVTDTAEPTVLAAGDWTLKPCPGNPELAITPAECSLLGSSTVTVTASKLLSGQTYTVSVVYTSTGLPVSGAPDKLITGDPASQTLAFKNLPNGRDYTLTIVNANQTLKASGNIFLETCDLPTLAYTGASTMTPSLAGIGFLQFGLVLVGISLVRRRSGAREV
jgi:hypothetical protein